MVRIPYKYLTINLSFGSEAYLPYGETLISNKDFPYFSSPNNHELNKEAIYNYYVKELKAFKKYSDKEQIYFLFSMDNKLLRALTQCCKYETYKDILKDSYHDIDHSIKVFKLLKADKIRVLNQGCIRIFNVDLKNKRPIHGYIFYAEELIGDIAIVYSSDKKPFCLEVYRMKRIWSNQPNEIWELFKKYMPTVEKYNIQWSRLTIEELYKLHGALKELTCLKREFLPYFQYVKYRIALKIIENKGLKMYNGTLPQTNNVRLKEARLTARNYKIDQKIVLLNEIEYLNTIELIRIYCEQGLNKKLIPNSPLYATYLRRLKAALKNGGEGLTKEEVESISAN